MLQILDSILPLNTWSGDFGRLALVLGCFFVIFILAEVWHYTLHPPVEWTRKFVHLSCGILIACFHWIFASFWPIVLLTVLLGSVMGIARAYKLFPSIYKVERSSLGDLYYLFSVFVLYLISYDRPVIYFISVLVLTVADALAAIVGSTYKKQIYTVETHSKSLEGSLVFFLATFLIVHIPLLLMTDVDKLSSIMIALQIALIVTCLEAICINGFDNILIPIGTYYLLLKLLPVSPEAIAWQIMWQLIIIAILYYIALRFYFISISGAIAGQLFLYGAFVFGGPTWLIVPLIALGTLMTLLAILIYPKHQPPGHKIYQVVAAFHILIVPTLLFFAHNISEKYIQPAFWQKNTHFFYVLFIGAMAAHLAIAMWRFFWLYGSKVRLEYIGLLALAICSFALLIPFGLWLQTGGISLIDMSVDALIILIAIHIFYFSFRHSTLFQQFPWEFRIQSISAFCAVIIGVIYYGIIH